MCSRIQSQIIATNSVELLLRIKPTSYFFISHFCHKVINFCQERDKNRKRDWADNKEQKENWNVRVIIWNVITKSNCCKGHKDHVKGLQETEVLVMHEKYKNRYDKDQKDQRQCCWNKVGRQSGDIQSICDLLFSFPAFVDRK